METESRPKIQNKAPAPIQISAEKIVLESYQIQDNSLRKPNIKIIDEEELLEHQGRKRKEYEEALRRNYQNINQWLRYAEFEIQQNQFERARSIFERALVYNQKNQVKIWIRYINFELKFKNINHARNLMDRSVYILPMEDKLWFNYLKIEENLKEISNCIKIFEKWLTYNPSYYAWDAYIDLLKRNGNINDSKNKNKNKNENENNTNYYKIRQIFSRYLLKFSDTQTWLKWIEFEKSFGTIESIRKIFEISIDSILKLNNNDFNSIDENLLIDFAEWEASQNEIKRSRAIYEFGLLYLSENKNRLLFDNFTKFEKKFGNKEQIEKSIILKRKKKYELILEKDKTDYDTWWLYIKIIEELYSNLSISENVEKIRKVFDDCVKCTPKVVQKDYWRRYIFIWIKYIFWEELNFANISKVRELFKRILKIIPHKKFTFAKIWILNAKFEIRQNDIGKARKLFGMAIGMCSKPKLFKEYISIEIKLKEFDRVRKIYEKFLESYPGLINIWNEYAEFESNLDDIERSRKIYEIAINLPRFSLSSSNTSNNAQLIEIKQFWKKYIDFEYEQNQFTKSIELFEKFLANSGYDVKVWIEYANFELTIPTEEQLLQYQNGEDDQDEIEIEITEIQLNNARRIFEEALKYYRDNEMKEKRSIVMEAFKDFEEENGTKESFETLKKRMPMIVRKINKVENKKYSKEYIDYIFPDDAKKSISLNGILAKAKQWKMAQHT
ncbi:Clf1p [Ascoidea rubescens DSM 1968]|uniref:Pre-mRNA-splicing factor CLF1 n=1 Tax=Ascoidea rubescens DSM 1968 TaxID=1344418 RepID=A0A1D2VE50_9ASCO|nr:HCP-like protein [Ascoidea rubescens DSM 1968]ODV59862.1 HCP-like protein [Ascoidea rubescens DSM 1968]